MIAFSEALRGEGFAVHGPEERGVDLTECESRDCAETVLESLSADFAAALAVWARARGGSELAVTLYMPDGTTRDLSTSLDADPLAATRALASDVARSVRSFEPESAPEGGTTRSSRRASPVNYVLGGLGLGLALPAIVSAAITIARRGECVDTESGDCGMPAGVTHEVYVGPRTVTLMVAGAGLVGVSTYLFAKRPIRVGAAPRGDGFLITTHATF